MTRQLIHPLALLLWGAAGLSWLAGTPALTAAIVAVVLLNAALASWQEQQAERSVEGPGGVPAPARPDIGVAMGRSGTGYRLYPRT